MSRWLVVSLLSLTALVAVGSAANARGDDAALRREVDELRAEKNRLQDQLIELARRFDLEKKRLMDEKEQLQRATARLERDLAQARGGGGEEKPAAGGDRVAPLDRPVALSFDAKRLPDVAAKIKEATGLRVDLRPIGADPVVHLRVGRMPLRAILDLVVLNVRDGSGKLLDGLRWREADGGVVIEAAR